MAKIPGLTKRGTRWQFRRRVPRHLQEIVGRREIVKSLGDLSHSQARRLASKEWVEADALFEDAERQLRNAAQPEELTDEKLFALSRRYFERLEEGAGIVPINPDQQDELRKINDEDLFALSQSVEDASLQALALNFAKWANVDISSTHPRFIDYCRLIQRAEIEHHQRQADRLNLRQARSNDPIFEHPLKPGTATNGITLGEAIDKFLSASERKRDAPKTAQDWQYHLSFFARYFDDQKPMADISRQDVRDALVLLSQLPTNFKKKFPIEQLDRVAAIAEAHGLDTLKPQTVRRYITTLSALYRWLKIEGYQLNNPAADLKVEKDDESRRPRSFSNEELKKLFNVAGFTKGGDRSWGYWMPRIALFNGMRLNEIAGLEKSDIVKVEGIYCFNVRPNEFRSLKNDGARRTIPIHPKLLSLGILKLVEADDSQGALFADIPRPRNGHFNAAQKWLGRQIRKHFTDKKLVFHSLRHTFRDGTRISKMLREPASQIGGWKLPDHSVFDEYGSGYTIKALLTELSKLEFPDID